MNSKDQHTFEEEWQRAFEDAAVPPPDYLWDNIERELDKKERRRPFIFFLRPTYMGAAGIAAALLITLGGILWFNQKENSNTNLAKVEKQDTKIAQTENQKNNSTEEKPTTSTINENSLETTKTDVLLASNEPVRSRKIESRKTQETISFSSKRTAISTDAVALNTTSLPIENNNNILIINPLDGENKNTIASLTELNAKDFEAIRNRFILKRPMLSYDFPEENQEQKLASNDSKFWVGVQSGGGSFNPNMQLGGLSTLASNQADLYAQKTASTPLDPQNPGMAASVSPAAPDKVAVTQSQNAIQTGFALNTSVGFGYKLSEKWHLESGLRYLRGNTTLNSNTFALQEANGYANVFLADYLAQKSASYSQVSSAFVADMAQVNNRYEYLMIPLQASYGIKLSKNTRLDVLAGFSADVFLNNVIESDNTKFIQETTFNTQSNTYKPLNISGLGGVRFNYLFGKHWQMAVGTTAQRAIFSGINANTNLRMQMRMWGINYGLNYRF